MKIRPLLTILNLLCFWSLTARSAELQLTATVDRRSLALNQAFTYTVEISGDKAKVVKSDPKLADISEFALYMGSSGTSQNIQIINGKMSVSKSISTSYVANKAGTFQIPPAEIEFDGVIYRTDPIAIQIQQQSSAPRSVPKDRQGAASSSQATMEDDIFLRALVNKKRVYVNEPIILTYKIYTALTVTSYGISKAPNTAGFWVEEFPLREQPNTTRENYNGRDFLTAEIKKYSLFPTDAGTKTIGPMMIECDVRVQARSRSVFDGFFDDPFFGRSVRQAVNSSPTNIEVMPLPEDNKPADFSGAVGSYSITAQVDKKQVKTNDAIALKVTLSGSGNIKMLPTPHVEIPADFEQYDPKVSQQMDYQGNTITGSKSFEYVLIPRFPGIQKIKPVHFSYFDTKSGTYRRISTPEMEIVVEKGSEDLMVYGSGLSKEEVKLLGKDIRFIQKNIPDFKRKNRFFHNSGLYLALFVFPLVLLGAALIYQNHQDKLSGNIAYARNRQANQMAMKKLKKAKQVLSESTQKQFYAEASHGLLGFLADKFNISAAGMMTDQVEELMKEHKINEQVISEYLSCLNLCDYQRFAPSNSTLPEMKEFYEKAKAAIIAAEKII